jgi:MFS family permease
MACQHLGSVKDVEPSSPDSCPECSALGDGWVNLRVCLECGHVGCCNASKNKHATLHHHATGHPVIQSYMPGEAWRYCYVDDAMLPEGEPMRAAPPPEPPIEPLVAAKRTDGPPGPSPPGPSPAGPNPAGPSPAGPSPAGPSPAGPSPTPKAIIRAYYWIAGTYTLAASCIWGVNTLFLLSAGLDIFEVFVANTAYTIGTVLFEIPTGVLADTRGRRASFLIGVIVLLLTTLAYVGVAQVGGGIVLFSFVSVLVGLGFAFYSGAVEAWLVDALEAAGYTGTLDPIFARSSMVTGFAMVLGTVGGGALGMISLSVPYVVRATVLGVSFAIGWFAMPELGFTARAMDLRAIPKEMGRVTQESFAAARASRPLRFLIGIQLVEWAFLMWAWYAWQPHFLRLWGNPDAVWLAGVLSALMSLAMIGGNGIVDVLTRYCGRRTTLMGWAMAIEVAAAIGVGLTGNFWVAVVLFMVMIGTAGVVGPVRSTSVHNLVTKEHRASVLSFDSMVTSTGSAASQTGLGWISKAYSIPAGFVVGGLFSVLALPLIAILRRMDDPSDFIVGKAREKQGGCAAEGTPPVGQLDV